MSSRLPRIALVHDHLTQDGGAEHVLRVLASMYPEAPIYTLAYDPARVPGFSPERIRTSYIQSLPLGLRCFEWFLPLMPSATEHYDLSSFDVVISSASAMAKGVLVSPSATHVCYCHTPTRYLWADPHDYLRHLKVPGLIKRLLPAYLSTLRSWDRLAAERVDQFVANSATVAKRIRRYYQKPSSIIYPPVDTERFSISTEPKTYFLAGGRMTSYKRFDLIVEAFNRIGLPLKIFGEGPFFQELQQRARPNITFLGRVSNEEQAELYRNCIAYLYPQVEDFGITAIEAMASGRPVIAFAQGGATEYLLPGVTGRLFHEQSWEVLADTCLRFDPTSFDPHVIREHAQQFSTARFTQQMRALVDEACGTPTGTTSLIEELLA